MQRSRGNAHPENAGCSVDGNFDVIVFRTANLLCRSAEVSLVVALSVGFGTQVWSVATRGLWSHTWLILLGTIAGWTILRAEIQRRDIPAIFLATILAWMYFVRPTAAIPILCVLCYLCVYHRKALGTFAVTGGLWLGAFVTYSWFTFHEILPGYSTCLAFAVRRNFDRARRNLRQPFPAASLYMSPHFSSWAT